MLAITRDRIDPSLVEAAVRSDACGGVVTFLGIVRDRANDGRGVTGLSYEAHDSMAVAEFERIVRDAKTQHGDVRVAILHRVGDLAIGDVAVAVCVASPHRAAAFEACQFAIDALKQRAPIWKKEHYVDGAAEWVANEC